MVYSSDFYTSRRPAYYKPATSYSVTPLYSSDGYELPPTYYKAHQVYQTCTTPTPFILTPAISTGKPSPNVLPYNGTPYFHHQYVPLHRRSAATIHGVLDRIEHRQRSHPSYDPTDEYLNSRSATTFDDVTRDIRAQTAGLLKQVYTPTYRPKISSVSNGYSEVPITQRIESDAYIEKILADSESYRRDNNIGKGHLACVSYAGGKAYPRRRPHLSKEVDDNITMLSYYNKTREAAALPTIHPKVKINSTKIPTFNHREQSEQNISEIKRNTTEPAVQSARTKKVVIKDELSTDEKVENNQKLINEIKPDTEFEESKLQINEKKTEDTVPVVTKKIINKREQNEKPVSMAKSAQKILTKNESKEEEVNPLNYLADEEKVEETQKPNEIITEREVENSEQIDLSENKTEDILSQPRNYNTFEVADSSSVPTELVSEDEEKKITAEEKEKIVEEDKEEENIENIEDKEEAEEIEETKNLIDEINTEKEIKYRKQDTFEFVDWSISTNEITNEEEEEEKEKEIEVEEKEIELEEKEIEVEEKEIELEEKEIEVEEKEKEKEVEEEEEEEEEEEIEEGKKIEGEEEKEEQTKNEKLNSSNYLTAEEDVSLTEVTDLNEHKTQDVESEFQKHNSAAISESSTTTTEVTNSDDGIKTTAIFHRTVKKTTTVTSSTTVTSEGDNDTTVEIQEIIEEDGNDDEDDKHHNTENKDSAQVEGHESSEEEDESEEDEEESGEE